MMKRPFHKQVYKVHRWLGLISSVLLLVVCVTGSIVVFKTEIDYATIPQMHIDVPANGSLLSPDEIVDHLRAAVPGIQILRLPLESHAGQAVVVLAATPGKRPQHFLMNPYTGHLIRQSQPEEDWGKWLRSFHTALFLGWPGRIFVGFLGVTLLASILTGLYFYKNIFRGLFRVRWNRSMRIVTSDLHILVGLWALLFNLLIASTGAVLGLEIAYNRWWPQRLWPKTAQVNLINRIPTQAVPPLGQPMLTIAQALEIAKRAYPHMEPQAIALPNNASQPIKVHGKPRHRFQKGFANHVIMDPSTGQVVQVIDASKARWWTKLYQFIEPLHFGRFGGLPIKIIYCLGGLTPAFLGITGTMIWIIRRRYILPCNRRCLGSK